MKSQIQGAIRGVTLCFHTFCPPYQESDPQVIERQCQKMNGHRIDCCFPGNQGEHRGWDGVIKRGQEREWEAVLKGGWIDERTWMLG